MTIRHLRILIAVADTGKMSAAAKQLYIAQPTVSQAIGEIENFYNVRLFERLSKKLYITDDGRRLLGYARHIVALFDEMEKNLQDMGRDMTLKVGATITVGSCVLAPIVNRFEAAHGNVRVEVFVDNSSMIEESLLCSKLDLGLVEGRIKSPDLLVRPVIRDDMVLVCSQEHPFAALDTVNPSMLEGQPFILREEGSGTRELFQDSLEALGVEICPKWVCHSSDAILSAVAAGQGITVISRRIAEPVKESKGLRILPIDGMDLHRDFSLVYHRNKFLSPAVSGFIDACLEYGDTLQPGS